MAVRQRWLIGLLIVLVLGAATATVVVSQRLLAATSPTVCANQPDAPVHEVTLQHDQASPAHTTARLCDRLILTNADAKSRLVAFGPHESHVPYDGVAERLLAQGESLTITLNQAGSFRFHDHLDDQVQGTFSVTAPK